MTLEERVAAVVARLRWRAEATRETARRERSRWDRDARRSDARALDDLADMLVEELA